MPPRMLGNPAARKKLAIFILCVWPGLHALLLPQIALPFVVEDQGRRPIEPIRMLLEQQAAPPRPTGTETPDREKSQAVKPLDARTTVADDLLNRCYEEALTSESRWKLEALIFVAESMQKLNPERAVKVYEQAFDATLELQTPESRKIRLLAQGNIVLGISGLNVEKGADLALKIDRAYAWNDPSLRLLTYRPRNVLGTVLTRLAGKNPDRAYEIASEEARKGNLDFPFVARLTILLKTQRPALAEKLYINAIRGFENSTHDMLQIDAFVQMADQLWDLSPTLTEQAVGLIVRVIDDLEREPLPEENLTILDDGKKRTIYSGTWQHATKKLVEMERRLDPDRARALETRFAQYGGIISWEPLDLLTAPPAAAPVDPAMAAMNLVRKASSLYDSAPQQAKSFLSEASSAAEKLIDPFSRGVVYRNMANLYLKFDRERAKNLLNAAFAIADKLFEEESHHSLPSSDEGRAQPEFLHSRSLYQQLIYTLVKLDIEEAKTRAEGIKDKNLRLIALITVADAILKSPHP